MHWFNFICQCLKQTTHHDSLYITGIDETMRVFAWKDDGKLWQTTGELEFCTKPATWEIMNTV